MSDRVLAETLSVDRGLFDFVANEVLPGSGISSERFWSGYAAVVRDFAPRHREMCERRDALQRQIDEYHVAHKGHALDGADYKAFLERIGYVLPEPADFTIKRGLVDAEIAPTWLRSWLIALVDLMAAVPSVVYGLWGFKLLQGQIIGLSKWLNTWFGWIPIFDVTGANPNDPLSSAKVLSRNSLAMAMTLAPRSGLYLPRRASFPSSVMTSVP